MIDCSKISEEAYVPVAMREGWLAYTEGKPRADNPYDPAGYNKDFDNWDIGWAEAQAAEEYQNDRTIT
jgi:hypothetical protein